MARYQRQSMAEGAFPAVKGMVSEGWRSAARLAGGDNCLLNVGLDKQIPLLFSRPYARK